MDVLTCPASHLQPTGESAHFLKAAAIRLSKILMEILYSIVTEYFELLEICRKLNCFGSTPWPLLPGVSTG